MQHVLIFFFFTRDGDVFSIDSVVFLSPHFRWLWLIQEEKVEHTVFIAEKFHESNSNAFKKIINP